MHHWRFYNQLPPSFAVLGFPQYGVPFKARPVSDVVFPSFSLSLRLPPCTVSYWTVVVSSDDHVTYPHHFSLRLFTEVRRSSYGPMAPPPPPSLFRALPPPPPPPPPLPHSPQGEANLGKYMVRNWFGSSIIWLMRPKTMTTSFPTDQNRINYWAHFFSGFSVTLNYDQGRSHRFQNVDISDDVLWTEIKRLL